MSDDTRGALEALECKSMVERERLETVATLRLTFVKANGAVEWYSYAAPCGRTFPMSRRVLSKIQGGTVRWKRDDTRIEHPQTIELLEAARKGVQRG